MKNHSVTSFVTINKIGPYFALLIGIGFGLFCASVFAEDTLQNSKKPIWKCSGIEALTHSHEPNRIKLSYLEINAETLTATLGVSGVGEGSPVEISAHPIDKINLGRFPDEPVDFSTGDQMILVSELKLWKSRDLISRESKLGNKLGSPVEIYMGGIRYEGEIECVVSK
jgi:hypothetical protein